MNEMFTCKINNCFLKCIQFSQRYKGSTFQLHVATNLQYYPAQYWPLPNCEKLNSLAKIYLGVWPHKYYSKQGFPLHDVMGRDQGMSCTVSEMGQNSVKSTMPGKLKHHEPPIFTHITNNTQPRQRAWNRQSNFVYKQIVRDNRIMIVQAHGGKRES